MTTVNLYLDGVFVQTIDLDASGYAVGNLLIDVATIGTHTLTAEWGEYSTVTSGIGTGAFTVVALATPAVPPIDPNPVYVPPVVARWQFQDPVTGDLYAFPINPSETTSPLPPRPVLERPTTTGVLISHEGAPQPFSWSFKGTVLTEAQYLAFRAWADLKYRIWVTDHFSRRFEVRLNEFTHALASPLKAVNVNPYYGTYEMKTTVFAVAS